jgi:hypothetical protein
MWVALSVWLSVSFLFEYLLGLIGEAQPSAYVCIIIQLFLLHSISSLSPQESHSVGCFFQGFESYVFPSLLRFWILSLVAMPSVPHPQSLLWCVVFAAASVIAPISCISRQFSKEFTIQMEKSPTEQKQCIIANSHKVKERDIQKREHLQKFALAWQPPVGFAHLVAITYIAVDYVVFTSACLKSLYMSRNFHSFQLLPGAHQAALHSLSKTVALLSLVCLASTSTFFCGNKLKSCVSAVLTAALGFVLFDSDFALHD